METSLFSTSTTIRHFFLGVVASLLAAALWSALPARAGTVIASTVSYNGADIVAFQPQALPEAGVYQFSLVVQTTPTASSSLAGLRVYLQQQGLSGAYYTLNASTFTTCAGACTSTVYPDVYVGGNVRAQWDMTTGSATIKVTANKVNP